MYMNKGDLTEIYLMIKTPVLVGGPLESSICSSTYKDNI